MLLEVLRRINWVDILVIIILFRIGYVAIKNGLSAELFKFMGTLLAVYLSLHYYTALADWVRQRLGVDTERVPLEFLDFICFVVLTIAGYLVFVLLRLAFYRLIKMEAAPRLNQWGGFVLGIARGFLLIGLVIFMLVISSVSYLKTSVANSYSGRQLIKVAPDTYSWLWDNILSKFMPTEKFNQTAVEVQKGLAPQ